MTGLAEVPPTEGEAERSVGSARWRAAAHMAQDAALPAGTFVVSCSAAIGQGGLGRHLQEFVDALDRLHQPNTCICGSNTPPRARSAVSRIRARAGRAALALPPLRLATAQHVLDLSAQFDHDAAGRLPAADHLIAFNGLALEQIEAMRRAGCESTSIVSATSHFRRVVRQHARAHRQYPLEGSWAARMLERNLSEYALADRIYVASEYVRESFHEEGFGAELLPRFPLTPDPRFVRRSCDRTRPRSTSCTWEASRS